MKRSYSVRLAEYLPERDERPDLLERVFHRMSSHNSGEVGDFTQPAPFDPVAGLAAGILVLEAIGIAVLVFWQVQAITSGDVAELPSALALLVCTIIAAIAVGAFAVAVWRGSSWGRSGGIVTQLLVLAVAGGALTGIYAEPIVALGLAVPALLALIALIATARRASARDRAAYDDEQGA